MIRNDIRHGIRHRVGCHVIRLVGVLRHIEICSREKRIRDTTRSLTNRRRRWKRRGRRLLVLLVLHVTIQTGGFDGLFIIPSPFFFKFCIYETDSPSGFLSDLVEYLQDLFLLTAGSETLGSNGK